MIPVLQMRKPRLRDREWLAQGPPLANGLRPQVCWTPKPGLLTISPTALEAPDLSSKRVPLELQWWVEWQGGDWRQRMGQEAGATQRGGEGALRDRGVACPNAL